MININSKVPIIGIYKITSPSGKVYVGQSTNIYYRWANYKSLNKKSIGSKLYNSLKKYGWNNHISLILEECSLEQLKEKEVYYKQMELNKVKGKWSKVLFCDLYDNGGGYRSEYTKLKISKGLKGRINSNETKEKMSIAKKGISLSKEHVYALRISRSKQEWKQKLQKSILQYNLNNTLIREWSSIKEAGETLNINQSNIGSVCSGKFKTAGGYIWKYKNK